MIVGIDTGTTKTGYCIMQDDLSSIKEQGKIDNEQILALLQSIDSLEYTVVFERFAAYGMSRIGMETVNSIVWYGRYIQVCEERGLHYHEIYRRDVKKHILGKIDKSKGSADSQVRRALVERFARFDKKNGKGTKDNPDYFYGCASTDVYASIAVVVCFVDNNNKKDKNNECN